MLASFLDSLIEVFLAVPSWLVAALIAVPIGILFASLVLKGKVLEVPTSPAQPGMQERFERVASGERFRWLCAALLKFRPEDSTRLEEMLRHKTRYATCGAVSGFADCEDDPTDPSSPRIVLALSPGAHASRSGDATAAHELFHLARHVAGQTPFPTSRYGTMRRLGEEILVWILTALHSPGSTAWRGGVFLALVIGAGFLFYFLGAWLLNP